MSAFISLFAFICVAFFESILRSLLHLGYPLGGLGDPLVKTNPGCGCVLWKNSPHKTFFDKKLPHVRSKSVLLVVCLIRICSRWNYVCRCPHADADGLWRAGSRLVAVPPPFLITLDARRCRIAVWAQLPTLSLPQERPASSGDFCFFIRVLCFIYISFIRVFCDICVYVFSLCSVRLRPPRSHSVKAQGKCRLRIPGCTPVSSYFAQVAFLLARLVFAWPVSKVQMEKVLCKKHCTTPENAEKGRLKSTGKKMMKKVVEPFSWQSITAQEDSKMMFVFCWLSMDYGWDFAHSISTTPFLPFLVFPLVVVKNDALWVGSLHWEHYLEPKISVTLLKQLTTQTNPPPK